MPYNSSSKITDYVKLTLDASCVTIQVVLIVSEC